MMSCKEVLPPTYLTAIQLPYNENRHSIRCVFDSPNLCISIDDWYVGKLKVVSNLVCSKLFGGCRITINRTEYCFNRDAYKKHLNSLGIPDITCGDYNTEVQNISANILSHFRDRIWLHLSPDMTAKLSNDFYNAVRRNDYGHAMNLIQNGARLSNFYIVKEKDINEIFLERPSNEAIIKVYKKATRVLPYVMSCMTEYRYMTSVCHSPLTFVLSIPKSGVQDSERDALLRLLIKWGASTVVSTLKYTIRLYKNINYHYDVSVYNCDESQKDMRSQVISLVNS